MGVLIFVVVAEKTGEKVGEAMSRGGVMDMRRLTLAAMGLDDHLG